MYKNSLSGGYNLDGTRHDKIGYISPIFLIMPEDESNLYHQGWYFCDEVEQLNGPFNTIEEAIECFKNYEV